MWNDHHKSAARCNRTPFHAALHLAPAPPTGGKTIGSYELEYSAPVPPLQFTIYALQQLLLFANDRHRNNRNLTGYDTDRRSFVLGTFSRIPETYIIFLFKLRAVIYVTRCRPTHRWHAGMVVTLTRLGPRSTHSCHDRFTIKIDDLPNFNFHDRLNSYSLIVSLV